MNEVTAYGGKRDKPTLIEATRQQTRDIEHGLHGHRGYRCRHCAAESIITIELAPTGVDHWQNKQISWQEECDVVFREFDDSVAAHFPVHRDYDPNCPCPTKPDLPEKPLPPVERATVQNARN